MLFSEMLSDERREGMEEGEKKGEKKFADLTAILIRESKSEELLKAASDEEFREKMYQKYGIM